MQTLNGHTGTVTCLSSDSHRVVSGSDDGSLVLWTYKRCHVATGHPSGGSGGYGGAYSSLKPPPALALEKLAASFGTAKGKVASTGRGAAKGKGASSKPSSAIHDYHQGYNAITVPVAAEERPTAIVAAAAAAASEAAALAAVEAAAASEDGISSGKGLEKSR